MKSMFIKLLLNLLIITGYCQAYEKVHYIYDFIGQHYIASFKKCESTALENIRELYNVFKKSVIASGATLLKTNSVIFRNGSITIVCLVSESHASIHTYPEHKSCFVDLFTCGDSCNYEEFDKVLREYLKPEKVKSCIFTRS